MSSSKKPKSRIIIDTDPGIDDILAMLLAFSASSEELEVLMLSLTFGNVDVGNCLRNVMSLFSIIGKEQDWRRRHSRPPGFDVLKQSQPLVAVGASEPLGESKMLADYFHGVDGLGNIHSTHPHFTPEETWRDLFKLPPSSSQNIDVSSADVKTTAEYHTSFTPSDVPAHKLMLQLLADNLPQTITIVAIGPLTNLALAASEDVETFLRVKEVVVMGGAVDVPGNITPSAEFNTHADTIAFARILALTSPNSSTTMPPTPSTSTSETYLPPYPTKISRRLPLTLLPLDITTSHKLTRSQFNAAAAPLLADPADKSPLAEWMNAYLTLVFEREKHSSDPALSLHDPLAVYYAFAMSLQLDTHKGSAWQTTRDEDIRVETMGQWTRGACVVDRRGRKRRKQTGDLDDEKPSDRGGWLDERKGNRVSRLTETPWSKAGEESGFAEMMLKLIFQS